MCKATKNHTQFQQNESQSLIEACTIAQTYGGMFAILGLLTDTHLLHMLLKVEMVIANSAVIRIETQVACLAYCRT